MTLLFTAIGILALILSGCGGRSDTIASKDYIYRHEELPASEEMEALTTMVVAGNAAYMYGMVYDDAAVTQSLIVAQLNEQGEIISRAEFEQPQGVYINTVTGNDNGDLFCIKTVYNVPDDPVTPELPIGSLVRTVEADDPEAAADSEESGDSEETADSEKTSDGEETADSEETSDGEETGDIEETADTEEAGEDDDSAADAGRLSVTEIPTELNYLTRLDMSGSEEWSVCLNDIAEINDQNYIYVNSLVCLPDDELLISTGSKYAKFDSDGNYQGLLKLSGPGAAEFADYYAMLLTLADGRLLSYRHDDGAMVIQELNPDSGVLGEEHKLTGSTYSYSLSAGVGYDIFISDNHDLYGYNLGQDKIKLMNFLDSDLDINNISNIWGQDPTIIMGVIYDNFEGKNYLARFTKIPPEEVPDKVSITMAGTYIDYQVKGQIVKFNKSSNDYRIQLLDYSSMYGTPEDYAGVNRLNSDIASGKIPDILLLSADIPIKSYIAKGLFADLLPLLEKDEELSIDDLLPNVVEAFTVDGKLYQLVPHFYISTVFAKTSVVGSEPGWTLKEAQDILAQRPEGTTLFADMTQETMLYYYINYCGEQFIDWETGKCNFDGEEFIQLLEYIKTYPVEIDYAAYDESYWMESRNSFRDGKVLAQTNSIDSFRWFKRTQEETFGEEVTMIGFPSENGLGSSISSFNSFAISARSDHKEVAWEILRYYLSEEYQAENSQYQLPITRKAFELAGEEAMEKTYYTDEQGNRVETEEYYYVNDEEFLLEPLSAEEWAKLKDFIMSVNETANYDSDLQTIIREETAPYFEGQKTVEEVVDIIQSRAQIYISENI